MFILVAMLAHVAHVERIMPRPEICACHVPDLSDYATLRMIVKLSKHIIRHQIRTSA